MITIILNQQESPSQCNIFLSGQTGKALTNQCSTYFGFQVKLYYDQQFQHPIQQDQQLYAQNVGKFIFAQRIENSTYGEVTCWFNVDGVDKEQGVSLRSDFTIEEVIQDALERDIIQLKEKNDYQVKVTDNQKQNILAQLKVMQMFKLIDQNNPQPELIIFLNSDGSEPTITQSQQFYPPIKSQFPTFSMQPISQPISQLEKNNQQSMLLSPFSAASQFTQFNNQTISQQFQKLPEFKQQEQKQPEFKQQAIIKQGIAISQPLSQSQDDNQEIIDEAKKILKQFIILKNVSVIIDQSGQYVSYKYHQPKQFEGIFTHQMGKTRTIFTQNWINICGIKIQEINDGFAIEWKDGKQNSISVIQF